MSETKRLVIRLLLSGVLGICVALVPLSLVVGGGSSRDISFRRASTRSMFKRVDRFLDDYRRQYGTYPADLSRFRPKPFDGWQRPLRYSLRGGKPFVESLGRDGAPGGIGMDADISNQLPNPPQSHVPFLMRVTDPDALQMSIVACVCGLFAALMAFSGLQNQTFAARTWPLLGGALLLSLALAAVGAVFITAMHIPSGH